MTQTKTNQNGKQKGSKKETGPVKEWKSKRKVIEKDGKSNK